MKAENSSETKFSRPMKNESPMTQSLVASVETGLVPPQRCEKLISKKRSREFARNPVEEYGIMGEQKANIFRSGDFDSYQGIASTTFVSDRGWCVSGHRFSDAAQSTSERPFRGHPAKSMKRVGLTIVQAVAAHVVANSSGT
jgi:hypothetical protein